MNKNLTEIVYILDRSGSMSGLEKDTIGGYNSFLKKQKAEHGQAVVTTVLFDDKCEIIHDRVDIRKVRPLTNRQYYARGMTALLDAIGETISHVSGRHKNALSNEVPGKTIVVITTDGYENASRKYNYSMVNEMVNLQKEKYGWEFLFLGANIDAIETATGFGITKECAVTYAADEVGTKLNFASVSEAVSDMRASRPLASNWKKNIEEHLKKTRK